jgi:predicted AlkP superfamily phosphohydrolase/phosphomutase
LGIDAATFSIIKPNIDKLNNFKRILNIGKSKEMILIEKPISPSVWCGMFSGKKFEEHKHGEYVKGEHVVRREDLRFDFIWDILFQNGKIAKAINVPFVIPPFSFGVDFKPVGFGLPSNCPDLLITVYTLLDRIQHFHWGEEIVLDWYRRLDEKLGELIFDTGFLENNNNQLIIISDHGFCSFGDARVRTLPEKTEYGDLKGDHSEKSILITANLDYDIVKPQDVFFAIENSLIKN